MDDTIRREGMEKISDLAKQARALLEQAEEIADHTGNSFTFDLSGRSMTYVPKNFQSSNCYDDGPTAGSWNSSSDYC